MWIAAGSDRLFHGLLGEEDERLPVVQAGEVVDEGEFPESYSARRRSEMSCKQGIEGYLAAVVEGRGVGLSVAGRDDGVGQAQADHVCRRTQKPVSVPAELERKRLTAVM